ncbi:ATPase, partial [Candidatus Geothermarchaeota archaeon]
MARYLITPDVIRRGILHRHILNGDISGDVLIPWSVLTYLDKATAGDDISHEKFLKEVNNIRKASEAGLIKLEYIGQSTVDGDIYQYIFELSRDYDAVILTSDPSKAKFFQAVGSKVKLLSPIRVSEPVITKYFDEDTMSVHLKEGVRPRAKKGRPGNWLYVELDEKPITRDEILEIIDEILDYTKTDPESFIEIDEKGVTIVQMRNYRIIIAKPPFSDGYEITAVKPVKKLSLEDYNLPPELIRRLRERAEGILIAGAPGEGKSTFSQALAEFYRGMGKVVKTIESPRDLQLPMDITQYSKSYGDDKTL